VPFSAAQLQTLIRIRDIADFGIQRATHECRNLDDRCRASVAYLLGFESLKRAEFCDSGMVDGGWMLWSFM